MKNTIKLSIAEAMVITTKGEDVHIELTMFGATVAKKELDAGKLGAVMFALDEAGRSIEQARMLRRAQEQAAS